MKTGKIYRELENVYNNITGDFLENVGYLAQRVHNDLVDASLKDYKTLTHDNIMNRLHYWFVDDGEDNDTTNLNIQ